MLVLESLEKSDAKVAEDLLGEKTFAFGLMAFSCAFPSQGLVNSLESCNPFWMHSQHG